MYFKSKKDALYTILIWGTLAILLYIIFSISLPLGIFDVVAIIIGLALIGWFVWLWFSLRYFIENNTLIIKAGPIKQTLDIQKIQKIRKEKSVITAAALAIDRLLLQIGDYKFVSISPKNEYEFIQLLLSKNPHIQIDDALAKLYDIKNPSS